MGEKLTVWSEQPPKFYGYHWAKPLGGKTTLRGIPVPFHYAAGSGYMDRDYLWGPMIPDAESLATQAAELAELRAENERLRVNLHFTKEQNEGRGNFIDRISRKLSEARNMIEPQLREEIERLRQSTLSAELLEEVRYLLQREIDLTDEDVSDATIQRIRSALSKLPPAPAQKEEST